MYAVIVNGRVVTTTSNADLAESLKEVIENSFKIISESGQMISWSIEVVKLDVFDKS